MDRPALSDSAKRKILGENAVSFCPRLARTSVAPTAAAAVRS